MQARTVQLRRQILAAVQAIQARGDYPSLGAIALEMGLGPHELKGSIFEARKALIASGELVIERARGYVGANSGASRRVAVIRAVKRRKEALGLPTDLTTPELDTVLPLCRGRRTPPTARGTRTGRPTARRDRP